MSRKRTPTVIEESLPPSLFADAAADSLAVEQETQVVVSGASKPAGKLGAMVMLIAREGGATLGDLQDATGWQAHSVRGALAGSLKKKYDLAILSVKTDGVRRYSISAAAVVQ